MAERIDRNTKRFFGMANPETSRNVVTPNLGGTGVRLSGLLKQHRKPVRVTADGSPSDFVL